MDNQHPNQRDGGHDLHTSGVSVRLTHYSRIGTLRYFDAAGAFLSSLAGVVGGPMPLALQALRYPIGSNGGEIVLADRSPTETLLLCTDVEQFASIERYTALRSDGCLVDLTGGIDVWAIAGARMPDLLTRLGSITAIPAPGHARVGRLAELAVMSLCIRSGEILLLVERVYSRHLMAWIHATVEDF